MPRQSFMSINSQKLAALFLAVVAPPAVTLVWLGLQLLQQDRALLAQRELESRQAAGQSIVASLEQLISDARRRAADGPLPDGAVRFTISDGGLHAEPAARLLWSPAPPRLQEAASEPFTDTEALEFRGDAQRALSTYAELSGSTNARIRAGALLRLARVCRRERKWDKALDAYAGLALLTHIAIVGIPADLVARTARCATLEEAGSKSELDREATMLEPDFLAGRWELDQAAWELTAEKIGRWTARPMPASEERKQASAVANWLLDELKSNGRN